MQIIFGLSFYLLVTSALGQEACERLRWGFEICTESGTITRVSAKDAFVSTYFSEELQGDAIIGANAFRNLELETLNMRLPYMSRDSKSSTHSLSLVAGSFAGLSNLTCLSIDYANISFNGENPLAPLGTLTTLELKNGNLTKIPTEILASLPNIEELSFEGNEIRDIRSDYFTGLKRLQKLDVSSNKIVVIEPGSFSGLNRLESLDLSLNAFPAAAGLFRGIRLLKVLRISRCFDDSGFQSYILDDVPHIHTLHLAFNNLTTLTAGMFNPLISVREISLYGNQIRHIPKGVFERLRTLKEISIADNEIETITPGAFGYLELDDLILSLNRVLKTIQTDTFRGLTIRRLSLARNNIVNIEPNAFNLLHVTQMVDLTENLLTKVDTEDFSGLRTKDLDLSQNRIRSIAENAFGNTVMERFGLYGNPVNTTNHAMWGLGASVKIMK